MDVRRASKPNPGGKSGGRDETVRWANGSGGMFCTSCGVQGCPPNAVKGGKDDKETFGAGRPGGPALNEATRLSGGGLGDLLLEVGTNVGAFGDRCASLVPSISDDNVLFPVDGVKVAAACERRTVFAEGGLGTNEVALGDRLTDVELLCFMGVPVPLGSAEDAACMGGVLDSIVKAVASGDRRVEVGGDVGIDVSPLGASEARRIEDKDGGTGDAGLNVAAETSKVVTGKPMGAVDGPCGDCSGRLEAAKGVKGGAATESEGSSEHVEVVGVLEDLFVGVKGGAATESDDSAEGGEVRFFEGLLLGVKGGAATESEHGSPVSTEGDVEAVGFLGGNFLVGMLGVKDTAIGERIVPEPATEDEEA